MEAIVFLTMMSSVKIREKIDGVKKAGKVIEAHPLTGKYDIYAKISVKDEKELLDIVEKLRFIDGVLSTETCIIAD